MEKIQIKSLDRNTGARVLLEAIHNSDFKDREGYDSKFLGVEVPLPVLTDEVLKHAIAINQKPGKSGPHYLDYLHFTIMFNKDKKLPFFTAVNIIGATNELAKQHEPREGDKWFKDERIKIGGQDFQFNNEDYTNSGFQRGHMVRYYDPSWDVDEEKRKIAMGDTFHFTNCCPQLGKYNIGVWNDLEDYYMARAIFQDKKMSVFSGPVFNKAKRIGSLLVPVNFWKVVVFKEKGHLKALAFLITHEFAYQKLVAERFLIEGKLVKPTLKKSDIDRLFNETNIKKWVVKLELIEEKTGISFGLNNNDLNKGESKYYNIRASEFGEEAKRMGYLTRNKGDAKSLNEDTKFIQNI